MKILVLLIVAMLARAVVAGGPTTAPTTKPSIHSTVFLIQSSGSMVNYIPQIVDQVQAAIDGFSPDQRFSIIVAQDAENSPTFFRVNPVVASQGNKDDAAKFLSKVKAEGLNDLIPSLKLAFGMRPDVIWVLSNGQYENNSKVFSAVKADRAGGKTHIDTSTAFAVHDDGGRRVLNQLATMTGGVCIDENGKPYVPPAPAKPSPPTTAPRRHPGDTIFHE